MNLVIAEQENLTPEQQAIIDEAQRKLDALDNGMPKDGQKYWFLHDTGAVGWKKWCGNEFDLARWNMGSIYRTEAEAIAARDRQLATVRVTRRIAELDREVVDWGNKGQKKFFFVYDHDRERLSVDLWHAIQDRPSNQYSTSRETMETIKDEMHDDVLLMLGVSDE